MTRKKDQENKNIPDATPSEPLNAYVTWDDTNLSDKREALAEASNLD
jgi:hypothetical protein